MSQRGCQVVMICGACFAFLFLAAEVMAEVPKADLRGQFSRYRTSTTRPATPTATPTRSAIPAGVTRGADRGQNRQTLSQFQLLQLQQQLLLQKQQLNQQQFTLVPDGRGGVVAVPVVNPLAIPVVSPAVQKPQQRVNRIRVGK